MKKIIMFVLVLCMVGQLSSDIALGYEISDYMEYAFEGNYNSSSKDVVLTLSEIEDRFYSYDLQCKLVDMKYDEYEYYKSIYEYNDTVLTSEYDLATNAKNLKNAELYISEMERLKKQEKEELFKSFLNQVLQLYSLDYEEQYWNELGSYQYKIAESEKKKYDKSVVLYSAYELASSDYRLSYENEALARENRLCIEKNVMERLNLSGSSNVKFKIDFDGILSINSEQLDVLMKNYIANDVEIFDYTTAISTGEVFVEELKSRMPGDNLTIELAEFQVLKSSREMEVFKSTMEYQGEVTKIQIMSALSKVDDYEDKIDALYDIYREANLQYGKGINTELDVKFKKAEYYKARYELMQVVGGIYGSCGYLLIKVRKTINIISGEG